MTHNYLSMEFLLHSLFHSNQNQQDEHDKLQRCFIVYRFLMKAYIVLVGWCTSMYFFNYSFCPFRSRSKQNYILLLHISAFKKVPEIGAKPPAVAKSKCELSISLSLCISSLSIHCTDYKWVYLYKAARRLNA